MSPDTSAQDAPVASQEAEAREWEIAEAEFQRGYAAGRASERERYAALLSALISSCSESDDWGGYCFFCGGEQTLDYDGDVHDYLDHKVDCPWVEARIALAALEEAGSA